MVSTRTVSLCSVNCQGYYNISQNSRALQKHELLCIQECGQRTYSLRRHFPNHNTFISNNLALINRKNIHIFQIQTHDRFLHIQIQHYAQILHIISLHSPHSYAGKKKILHDIQQIIRPLNSMPVVVLGDFNMCATAHDHDSTSRNDSGLLLSFMRENNLHDSFRLFHGRTVARTHVPQRSTDSSARLDYILVNNEAAQLCKSASIDLDTIPGDHAPVSIELCLHGHAYRALQPCPVRFKEPESWDTFRERSEGVYLRATQTIQQAQSIQQLNAAYGEFEKDLQQCCIESLPKFQKNPHFTSNRKLDIITQQMLLLKKTIWIAHKSLAAECDLGSCRILSETAAKFSIQNSTPPQEKLLQLKKILKRKRKEFRSTMRRIRKNDFEEKWSSVRRSFCTGDAAWFRKIKSRLSQDRSTSLDYVQRNPNTYGPATSVINNEIHAAWSRVFSNQNPHRYNSRLIRKLITKYMPSPPSPQILTAPFSREEIESLFQKTGKKKAPGGDGITYSIIRNSHRNSCITFLLSLFNQILRFQDIPQTWKHGEICLLPKNPSPSVLDFRPIMLLSCIYKSFSLLIKDRLQRFCDEHELISPEQSGFRTGTRDNIILVREAVADTIRRKDHAFLLFIDFSKAYDSIDWRLLNSTLLRCTSPQFQSLINNILVGSVARIRHSTGLSDPILVQRGVKQGDNISPILFNLSVEPILRYLKDKLKRYTHPLLRPTQSPLLAYADDVVLLLRCRRGLERAADLLNKVCRASGLSLNVGPSKTAVMPIGCSLNTPIKIGSQTICTVDQYPYLGFLLCKDNSSTAHVRSRYQKAEATRERLQFATIDYVQMVQAIKTFYRSKFSYCVELCFDVGSPTINRQNFLTRLGQRERGLINSVSPKSLKLHKRIIHATAHPLGLGLEDLHCHLITKLAAFWLRIRSSPFLIRQYCHTLSQRHSFFWSQALRLIGNAPIELCPADHPYPVLLKGLPDDTVAESSTQIKEFLSSNEWISAEAQSTSVHSLNRFADIAREVRGIPHSPRLSWFYRSALIPASTVNFIINLRFKRLPTRSNLAAHSNDPDLQLSKR